MFTKSKAVLSGFRFTCFVSLATISYSRAEQGPRDADGATFQWSRKLIQG